LSAVRIVGSFITPTTFAIRLLLTRPDDHRHRGRTEHSFSADPAAHTQLSPTCRLQDVVN